MTNKWIEKNYAQDEFVTIAEKINEIIQVVNQLTESRKCN